MEWFLGWAEAASVLARARASDFTEQTEPRESALLRVEWLHVALALVTVIMLLFLSRFAWSAQSPDPGHDAAHE
jgi:hypothetical protein